MTFDLLMKTKPLQKYFFFLIIATISCRGTTTFKRPDVSNIEVNVKIERFDQEFADLKPSEILVKNNHWMDSYGEFYTNYIEDMLRVASSKDSQKFSQEVKYILEQKEFKDLNHAVQKKFPSLQKQEKDIAQALKYILYYFPEYKIPRLISYVSGFAYQTPVGENYVGIGLDMFLGADSEFYPALVNSIPLYLSRRFTPENITPRVIEAILREDILPISDRTTNTLHHMIYNGKILYAMDVLLENATDELKIGYTAEQMVWAKKYQADIWSWFLQENLLYSTDHNRIQKYFTEAPFTPELGANNDSAPKLGSYIGWMIVRRYMDKHPDINLKQLFENEDAQKILEDSKFKGN